MLSRLNVDHLRCLSSVTIEPGPAINIVFGPNGSGKTSLLESIYLLARGHSFRTRRNRNLVSRNEQHLAVHALVQHPMQPPSRIAIHYDRGNGRIQLRANGKNLKRASELADYLPIALVNPDSHLLVDAGPVHRRQFLDWGVFHVEHSYLADWRRYQRCLRQRNRSLRENRLDPNIWAGELAESGQRIDAKRREYLACFATLFADYTRRLLALEDEVELIFKRGWQEDMGLYDCLVRGLERDRRLGYTLPGPHRCDIQFTIGRVPLNEFISRGQQKLVAVALIVAQIETFRRQTGRPCLLLIDDFTSELDRQAQARALELIRSTACQAILTALQDADLASLSVADDTMFHVKHGAVVAHDGLCATKL